MLGPSAPYYNQNSQEVEERVNGSGKMVKILKISQEVEERVNGSGKKSKIGKILQRQNLPKIVAAGDTWSESENFWNFRKNAKIVAAGDTWVRKLLLRVILGSKSDTGKFSGKMAKMLLRVILGSKMLLRVILGSKSQNCCCG